MNRSQDLIGFVERSIRCSTQEPRAFFVIPWDSGDQAVVYVTYRAKSRSAEKLISWAKERVFGPILASAKTLYWRNKEKIEVFSDDGWFYFRTRLAALDDETNPVRIESELTPEGDKCKEIDDEE